VSGGGKGKGTPGRASGQREWKNAYLSEFSLKSPKKKGDGRPRFWPRGGGGCGGGGVVDPKRGPVAQLAFQSGKGRAKIGI